MPHEKDKKIILGDCSIALHHNTSYEPPLYLFPELLPQGGSSSVRVWDGVADAVDIENSFWRVANLLNLSTVSRYNNGRKVEMGTEQVKTSLSSLIASNRLVAAGISTDILAEGKFSAQSIIDELEKLSKSCDLTEKEKVVVMDNHFINVLAWSKLREINCPQHRKMEESNGPGRKRQRETFCGMSASPTPWSAEVDDLSVSGRFIAGREQNVEEKVELLDTLTRLYNKPLASLCSRGQQTDYVVPPGTINVTSPYNYTIGRVSNLDVKQHLYWNCDSVAPCFKLRVFTVNTSSSLAEIPITRRIFNIGRIEGIRTGKGGSTCIHVGLGQWSHAPEQISSLHCSLWIRNDAVLLSNFGRNGVRVKGKKWILGQTDSIDAPCSLILGDICLEITKLEAPLSEVTQIKREMDA